MERKCFYIKNIYISSVCIVLWSSLYYYGGCFFGLLTFPWNCIHYLLYIHNTFNFIWSQSLKHKHSILAFLWSINMDLDWIDTIIPWEMRTHWLFGWPGRKYGHNFNFNFRNNSIGLLRRHDLRGIKLNYNVLINI